LCWVIKLIIWEDTAYKEYGTEHYLFKGFSSGFFFFRIFWLPCDDGKSQFDRIYTLKFDRCSFLYKIVSLNIFLQFSTNVPDQDKIATIEMSNVAYSLFVVFILFVGWLSDFLLIKGFASVQKCSSYLTG
jgi:hypothetical protein